MEERNAMKQELMRRMNSLACAAGAGMAKRIGLSQHIAGYTAEVIWACADDDCIDLEYAVSGGKPEDTLYIMATLADDQGNSYFAGSSSNDRQESVHKVDYTYSRKGISKQSAALNLHFEVTATTSQQYQNDWIMWTMRQNSIARAKTQGITLNYVGPELHEPEPDEQVFGPFSFDFSVPVYDFSETKVSQTVIIDGVPVTLARIRLTPLQAQFVFAFDQAAHPQILAKDLFRGMKLTGEGWELPAVGGEVNGSGNVWTSTAKMFLCDKSGEVKLFAGNLGQKRMEGYVPWAMPQADGRPTPLPASTWREIVLPGPWVFKFTMPPVPTLK